MTTEDAYDLFQTCQTNTFLFLSIYVNQWVNWHDTNLTHVQCVLQRVNPLVTNNLDSESSEHLSWPIRSASTVYYWSSDFGPGELTHSAVGRIWHSPGLWVSVQVCGTLCSYQTSLFFWWSRTDPLDKLTKWQRPPTPNTITTIRTYTQTHACTLVPLLLFLPFLPTFTSVLI